MREFKWFLCLLSSSRKVGILVRNATNAILVELGSRRCEAPRRRYLTYRNLVFISRDLELAFVRCWEYSAGFLD